MKTKMCGKCGEVLPMSAFRRTTRPRTSVDGYAKNCKTCNAVRPPMVKPTPTHLKCTRCGEVKEIEAFCVAHSRGTRGRSYYCRVCEAVRRIEQQDSAKMNARYHAEPELRARVISYSRVWQAKHPDKVRLYQRRYRAKLRLLNSSDGDHLGEFNQ